MKAAKPVISIVIIASGVLLCIYGAWICHPMIKNPIDLKSLTGLAFGLPATSFGVGLLLGGRKFLTEKNTGNAATSSLWLVITAFGFSGLIGTLLWSLVALMQGNIPEKAIWNHPVFIMILFSAIFGSFFLYGIQNLFPNLKQPREIPQPFTAKRVKQIIVATIFVASAFIAMSLTSMGLAALQIITYKLAVSIYFLFPLSVCPPLAFWGNTRLFDAERHVDRVFQHSLAGAAAGFGLSGIVTTLCSVILTRTVFQETALIFGVEQAFSVLLLVVIFGALFYTSSQVLKKLTRQPETPQHG